MSIELKNKFVRQKICCGCDTPNGINAASCRFCGMILVEEMNLDKYEDVKNARAKKGWF